MLSSFRNAALGGAGRVGSGGSGGSGGLARLLQFSPTPTVRAGVWQLISLSLRRGLLLQRDEALLAIDGRAAVNAPHFRYPPLQPPPGGGAAAGRGSACLGMGATGGGRHYGGLRGQLGPFVVFNAGEVSFFFSHDPLLHIMSHARPCP